MTLPDVFKPKAHTLTVSTDGRYVCSVCEWSWTKKPLDRWECPGVKRYEWWTAPPHLRTKRQLARMGLKPKGPPRACYQDANREVVEWLYDVRESRSGKR
jgi:hypothetical protein